MGGQAKTANQILGFVISLFLFYFPLEKTHSLHRLTPLTSIQIVTNYHYRFRVVILHLKYWAYLNFKLFTDLYCKIGLRDGVLQKLHSLMESINDEQSQSNDIKRLGTLVATAMNAPVSTEGKKVHCCLFAY